MVEWPWLVERGSLELGLVVTQAERGVYRESGARRPASGDATERGVCRESIPGLTGARAVVWRPGNGGEEMAEEALNAGSALAWRKEKKSRERCSGEWWCSSFILEPRGRVACGD
jgi:hypothetical protein